MTNHNEVEHLQEFSKIEQNIQDQLIDLRAKYEEVVEENDRLRSEIEQLKSSDSKTSEFGIEVGEGEVTAEDTQKPKPVKDTYNIPSTSRSSSKTAKSSETAKNSVKSSDKLSTDELDELLATDPLSKSVYDRLKDLGTIKQRVLAMQMGISQGRCQTAIDRLSSAGGVKVEDGDVTVASNE